MKPIKSLAGLVTLLLCGLPLQSAPSSALRTWTDIDGRIIEARIVAIEPSKTTIQIERGDGAHFNLPLLRLSAVDQSYVRTWAAGEAAAAAAADPALRELTPENWGWLARAGSVQNRNYKNAPVRELETLINQRLGASQANSGAGKVVGFRFDDEAGVETITLEVAGTVSLATVLRELAQKNELRLMIDARGFIVVQRAEHEAALEFFGVPVRP
jgi:hypothetical protein